MFTQSFMWLLPLSFFAYQFILRLWPSLMMQPIMQQFSIDATAFGFLASCYYYGYAGMQVPIAVLLDRYGARRVVFASALLCGLATLLFTYTTSWYLSLASRFLIGAGSAVGFLGTSKVVSEWFSQEKYAKMIGLTFTVGLLGAIYGGKPVSLLVDSLGGKSVALILGIVAIAIGFATLFFLKKPKDRRAKEAKEERLSFKGFKKMLSGPNLWLLGVANFLMVGALEGFADVWGVNYLQTAYGVSKGEAASLVSFIFVGMLFGGPLLALAAKSLGNYNVIALSGLGLSTLFAALLLFPEGFAFYSLAALFFAVGVLCCYQVIVFAAGSELASPALLGVTVAFLNCLNMFGGSFFHSLIGGMMDLFWSGGMKDGVRLYTAASYTKALALIPVAALSGAMLTLVVKLRLLVPGASAIEPVVEEVD